MKYILEYRENILFIRIIGVLNKSNISILDDELNNIIYKLGISNVVFNLEQLNDIDEIASKTLANWSNIINKRKGVSLVCGLHSCIKKNNLLSEIKEISNELCAIRVINWNN